MASQTTIRVLRALAHGVDPDTGELAAPQNTFQDPEIRKALADAISALLNHGVSIQFEPQKNLAEPIQKDGVLLSRLKAWRLAKAHELNLPAFWVFHDRTLKEVSAYKPRNAQQLQRISGVGPEKLGKYGSEILATVNEHVKEQP